MPSLTPAPERPVPRAIHAWAGATVGLTFALLALGAIVTTFRVGMADPIWPTHPWHLLLISWDEPSAGFLIEHTHRLAGFLVGAAVGLLALSVWLASPRSPSTWLGAAAIVLLLIAFGQFHREMRQQLQAPVLTVPMATVAFLVVSLLGTLTASTVGLFRGERNAGLRLLALVALIAVMIQGLLGGFRVRLNELVGVDLAAIHGCFGQVVFCLLVAVFLRTGADPGGHEIPDVPRRRCLRWGAGLTAILFLQLVWGVLVRHTFDPLAQRLHILTAFAVVIAALVLAVQGMSSPESLRLVRRPLIAIGILLALQLVLGVEAWILRFAGPTLPELRPVTLDSAVVRTLHVLTGTLLLALASTVWVRLIRWKRSPLSAGERTLLSTRALPMGGRG